MSKMMIEQSGEDCIVEIQGDTNLVKNCNALKLARTFWNKNGDRYSVEEMEKFGFELKVSKNE